MRHEAAWQARISIVLAGALRAWKVQGSVVRDPDDAAGFVIAPDAGPALLVRRQAPAGWTVELRAAGAGAACPPERHGGLPALLRRLRDELAPGAPAGRLVIGAQPLLGREAAER